MCKNGTKIQVGLTQYYKCEITGQPCYYTRYCTRLNTVVFSNKEHECRYYDKDEQEDN